MSLTGPGKLDSAEVIELRDHRKNHVWNTARQKWLVNEAYYRRTRAIWDNVDATLQRPSNHTGIATGIVDHAVDHVITSTPKVHCYVSGGEGDVESIHQKRASKKELFLTSVFVDSARKEPVDTAKQVLKNLHLKGYSPIQLDLDSEAEPEEPGKRDGEEETVFQNRMHAWKSHSINWNPFRIYAPMPETVLLDPWKKRQDVAISVYMAEAWQLNEITSMKRIQQMQGASKEVYEVPEVGKDRFAPIEVTRVRTDYWQEVYKGNTRLFSEKNSWGFVPLAHGYSGMGLEMASGDGTLRDAAYLCASILDPVIETIAMHERIVNAKYYAADRRAFAKMIVPPGKAAAIANQDAQGSVLEGNKDDISWTEYPEIAASIENFDLTLLRDIEINTFNNQIAGDRQQGIDTATQQIILWNASDKKFIPARQTLEQLMSIVGEWILRLVEIIGKPITVQGITLTPEDVDGIYDCYVTYPTKDPIVEGQLKAQAQAEVNMGVKSKRQYYEEFGGEDWEQTQDWIREEQYEASPYFVASKMAEIATKKGDLEVAKMFSAQADRLRQQFVDQIAQAQQPTNGKVTGEQTPSEAIQPPSPYATRFNPRG